MCIPRPDLSVKLGVPNACNSCHANQTPQWSAAAILKWTGKVPVSYQQFAEAKRAGTAGEPGARGTLAEFVAAQVYNADRPEGRSRLAQLYSLHGNVEGAIAEYRKAIEIDPTYVQAYANLADLYRARGVDTEADAILRQGIAMAPEAGVLRHALRLVFVRQKRSAEALDLLAQATRLDPDNARFA